MILRSVISSERQGKNVQLNLACGHSILRGGRQIAREPIRAICHQCSYPEEGKCNTH